MYVPGNDTKNLLPLFAMLSSAPITNVGSNKYIVLSHETYAIHNNKYNYNKIRPQIISKFGFL